MANQFNVERVYVKDVSFESPLVPMIFTEQWKPKVKLDLNTATRLVTEDRYEVDLRVTVTTETESDVTSMIVEVTQSGLFALQGFEEAQLKQVLATMCPNILFPYAREQIDSLMSKGGFPPLHLAPVNFDAVYAQALQAEAEQGGVEKH